MSDELIHYPPQAVAAGCREWPRQKRGFPELADILPFIDGHDRTSPRALPNPDAPENLLARIKRVTGRDVDWVRDHHDSVMKEIFPDHCDGQLSDSELRRRVDLVAERRTVIREDPQRSEQEILSAWAHNDRLASDMRSHPESYALAGVLIEVFSRFRAKRYRDHPALAASYYGDFHGSD
jgi:hypothetical protein